MNIAAGGRIPGAFAAGSVVELAPGVHRGALFVDGDLEVHGPDAVLDAKGRGAVAHVVEDRLKVVLSGLTLRGGRAQLGAGVFIEGHSEVLLRNVTIEAGRATGGGSAVGAIRGQLTLESCRVQGEALFTGVSRVVLRDTVVTDDLLVREGADVVLEGGAVEGSLDIRGTTTRAPTVTVRGTQIAELHNHPQMPGTLQ